MDFKKIHGKSFENQLIRMTDRFPNFVFLSTKIGCIQLNRITLSKNTPLSAAECLAYIWESDSSFLGLDLEDQAVNVSFWNFSFSYSLHTFTTSILLCVFFEYQHCRFFTGGGGKALN